MWPRDERRLELKDPLAQPARTEGGAHCLGYRFTRAGVKLGPKARQRMHERLQPAAAGSPERLHAALAAYHAAWTFTSLQP